MNVIVNRKLPVSIAFAALILLHTVSANAFQPANTDDETSAEKIKLNKLVQYDGAQQLGLDLGELRKIDTEMSKQVSDEKIVGCNALIFKDGKEAFYGHWGQRDREKEQPIARDTIFRIYSMSKPITSVAVMQLVEQGKLKLDDPVSKYLSELKTPMVLKRSTDDQKWNEVAAKREISVRDLLRHTSGLSYGFFGDTEVDKRYRRAGVLMSDATIEQTVAKLGEIALLHDPGSRFLYSVSTDVLGRLVEVVSETTIDKYLAANIFAPLGMKDTFFMVPLDKQDRFAQLYAPAARGGLNPARPLSSIRFLNPQNTFFSGGGGLCSTIDDYLAFSQMLLGNGSLNGKQIIKPETLKTMFTNQLDTIEHPPGSFKFGLGFSISSRGDYSWGGAAGTRFWVNPSKNLAVVYMIQINPYRGRKHGEFVLDAAYKAIK